MIQDLDEIERLFYEIVKQSPEKQKKAAEYGGYCFWHIICESCKKIYSTWETTMDRPLDRAYKRNRMMKRIAIPAFIFAACLALVNFGLGIIRPSVKRTRVMTAVVDTGDVLQTITASGTVVPEFEEVIISPIYSKVLKIMKQPGDHLMPGDSLLVLDTHDTKLAMSKIGEQIMMKHNQKEKLRVNLDIEMNDLRSLLENKKLRHEAATIRYEQSKKLFDMGGASKEQLRESKMTADIALIELHQVERSVENAEKLNRNNLNSLDLEIKILENEQKEVRRQLELAKMQVVREGVLTWIVTEEGSAIPRGDIIARIADLTSYRVEATVSDVHAPKLAVGLPVVIRINEDSSLDGTVSNILPTIENGIITFLVRIGDKTNELLRSNLRTDIYVVTAEKHDVPRITKGPFAQGNGIHDVFVIRGDRAVKTEASFGISSFKYLEVIEGLSVGDEVIISGMKDRLHAQELVLK